MLFDISALAISRRCRSAACVFLGEQERRWRRRPRGDLQPYVARGGPTAEAPAEVDPQPMPRQRRSCSRRPSGSTNGDASPPIAKSLITREVSGRCCFLGSDRNLEKDAVASPVVPCTMPLSASECLRALFILCGVQFTCTKCWFLPSSRFRCTRVICHLNCVPLF
jgi:hypothetical protein